jgi:hypothetical protein
MLLTCQILPKDTKLRVAEAINRFAFDVCDLPQQNGSRVIKYVFFFFSRFSVDTLLPQLQQHK